MTVGRRRLFLLLGFLTLTVVIPTERVNAQPPPHEVWGRNLTPDQLKEALSRFGRSKGDSNSAAFQELLEKFLAERYPDAKDQEKIKGLLKNKEFMEMAQQMAKDKAGQPGATPRFSQDEIKKMLESVPKDKLPQGLNLPQGLPDKNQNPNHAQPLEPNQIPDPKLPSPKKLGRPPAPLPPVQDPKAPDNTMPMGGPPPIPEQQNPGAIPDVGKQNPFGADNNPFGQPDEPLDNRSKSMSALASLWERNVGPLDDTPEVKRALFDLVSGENGFDFDMKDDSGNSFWDALKNNNGKGDNSAFSDLLNDGGGESWNWPKFEQPNIGWNKWFGNSSPPSNPPIPQPHLPEASSNWSFGGGGSMGGLSGSWMTVLLLGFVFLGALLLWWYLKETKTPGDGVQRNGLGPWPIDPRAINSREDVVKAFEYLSVLICGPSAKMWTHGTIAEALTDLTIAQGEVAMKLARLYELARYAPIEEPLTRVEVIEARHIVCDLAEVM